nr:hypothetical protein KPHV_61070 [Kitasatospora purpeofusca]
MQVKALLDVSRHDCRGRDGHCIEWYGYFMRRLAERPANLTFFLRAMATRG